MTTIQARNKRLTLISDLLFVAGSGLISNAYIQSYLLARGMATQAVTLVGTIQGAVALCAYILFTFYTPKGSYKPIYIGTSLGLSLLPLGLLVSVGLKNPAAYVLTIVAASIFSLMNAFRSSSEFSLVPYLFPRENYADILGKCGIIGCLLTAVVSGVGSRLFAGDSGLTGYLMFFAIAFGMKIACGVVLTGLQLQTPDDGDSVAPAKKPTPADILRRFGDRAFLAKLFPHLLRGFGVAGFYYFSLVGLHNNTLDSSQSALLILAGMLAQLIGSFAFLRLSRKVDIGKVTAFGIVAVCVCFVVMPLIRGVMPFMLVYFLGAGINYIVDNAVPYGVIRFTSVNDLPIISAARMLCTQCFYLIILRGFSGLVESNAMLLMSVCAVVYLISGLLFMRQFRGR
ncbi:MAG: hypothetical protein MJ099_00555 [Clostridia bacterium]|nr:hypothetical protein [Clostridia bacterium]